MMLHPRRTYLAARPGSLNSAVPNTAGTRDSAIESLFALVSPNTLNSYIVVQLARKSAGFCNSAGFGKNCRLISLFTIEGRAPNVPLPDP